MNLKTFAILGGHGAVATTHFLNLLTDTYLNDGAYEDEDFPQTIISNLPASVINSAGEIADIANLHKLIQNTAPIFATADHIVVLCNTFHTEQTYMDEAFHGNLMSLPQITRDTIAEQGYRKVLVVGSNATLTHQLYNDSRFIVVPSYNPELITAGMQKKLIPELLYDVIADAVTNQVDSIVLGCTDLSVFADELRKLADFPVIDSVETAVKTLIAIDRKNRS
jgi:aspartate/glutamate racemase